MRLPKYLNPPIKFFILSIAPHNNNNKKVKILVKKRVSKASVDEMSIDTLYLLVKCTCRQNELSTM